MTVPDAKLTLDMVPDAPLRRLAVLVTSAGLDVAISSLVRDNELIYKHITFPEGVEPEKAIEEVVYDNPLLTADFGKVNVVFDTPRFFVMAAEDATPDEVRRRIDMLWPPENLDVELEPVVNVIEPDRTVVVSAIPRKTAGFLRRTFNNPAIMHRIAALARYFSLKNHLGNSCKMHVRLSQGRTDIIAYGRTGLLMANTFTTKTTEDAAYYTMAAARHLGYDNDTDRILASGDRGLRDDYVASMRRFISFVMPDIFPSSLTRLGSNAMNVPFELLVPPLCE